MQSRSFTFRFFAVLLVLALGIVARWPQLFNSLWYDELTTLAQYVLQPWSKVLAAGAGDYVPNNHVFHTILVKLIYEFATSVPDESLLRIPAFVAGLSVPFALAWPVRRSNPVLALAISLVTMVNPWLVNFSTEARGYSLMLLLGIVATNSLFSFSVGYVLAMTLSIYTVPLALLLIPAHLLAVIIIKPGFVRKLIVQVGIVFALTAVVYLPMVDGLISYYRHPYQPTIGYAAFLNQLPRYALTGDGKSRAAIYWASPVIAIVIGSVLGWSRPQLRPLLLTLGSCTLFGVLLPLLTPGATEARFVPWICPWFCLAIVAAFFAEPNRWAQVLALCGLITLCIFNFMLDRQAQPNQPIREAFALADRIAPPQSNIMVLYLGARESIALYGSHLPHNQLLAAPDVRSMQTAINQSLQSTGHLPWVIIFYEKLAFDRNHGDSDSRGLWTNLIAHYHLATPRLPGRGFTSGNLRTRLEGQQRWSFVCWPADRAGIARSSAPMMRCFWWIAGSGRASPHNAWPVPAFSFRRFNPSASRIWITTISIPPGPAH